jgi:hypothetical protein
MARRSATVISSRSIEGYAIDTDRASMPSSAAATSLTT